MADSIFDRLIGRPLAVLTGRGRAGSAGVAGGTGGGAVDGLFAAVVAQARAPGFYATLGVPDTLDGRFDLIALHLFLVMRQLKGQGAEAAKLSQRLYETMVEDFETSLMEMGVGDTGIGRRVKTMARGMAGRIRAYDEALADPDDRKLEVVLDNNVYGTVERAPEGALAALAAYIRASAATLDGQPLADLLRGVVRFAPPPA